MAQQEEERVEEYNGEQGHPDAPGYEQGRESYSRFAERGGEDNVGAR
jgi:hypothetical protein